MQNGHSYYEIKNSWKYRLGKTESMGALLILSTSLIVAVACASLFSLQIALPLAIVAAGAVLLLAFSLYQWNNTRLHMNKIGFFQDHPPADEVKLIEDSSKIKQYSNQKRTKILF